MEDARLVKLSDTRYQVFNSTELSSGARHEEHECFIVWDVESGAWRVEKQGKIIPGPGFANPYQGFRNRNHSLLEMFINEVEQPDDAPGIIR